LQLGKSEVLRSLRHYREARRKDITRAERLRKRECWTVFLEGTSVVNQTNVETFSETNVG